MSSLTKWKLLAVAAASIATLASASHADAAVTPIVEGNELTVIGDENSNEIALSVGEGGTIAVNGIPTALAADRNAEIVVDALAGVDRIDAEELDAGTYRSLLVDGGAGNDQLTGGEGPDKLVGARDQDAISASGSNDEIFWNDGDGDDQVIGGAGQFDRLVVIGSDIAADELRLVAGETTKLERTNQAPFTITLPGGQGEIEEVSVNPLGGDDTFTASPALPTMLISAGGGPGDDRITGGAGPDQLFGGTGNDAIAGGANGDVIFGETGDDQVNGNGENDLIDGGDGNDLLTGGRGHDSVFGGPDDDLLSWSDGDGDEKPQGGPGFDALTVNGSPLGEELELSAGGLERKNPDRFRLDLAGGTGEFEEIAVFTGGGEDSFVVLPGLADLQVFADSGEGDDSLLGSEEVDDFVGGPGEDTLSAGEGDDGLHARDRQGDVVRGGPGDDAAVTDEVTVDSITEVERVDATPPAPPTAPPASQPPPSPIQPPPPPAPDITAMLPRLGKATIVRRGRKLTARLPISCPAAETGGCRTTVMLEARSTRRGSVALGSKNVVLGPGTQTKVSIPFAARVAALARHGRLAARIRISSSDAAGNTAAQTSAVVLRIPRL